MIQSRYGFPKQTGEVDEEAESGEQNSFDWAQEAIFGNTGHSTEYESRQKFLADFGFADKEPFYQYYDSRGNLQLELYLDETSGKGCGLIYGYTYNYQLEKQESACGFVFDAVYQGEWKAEDPYLVASVDGSTGENMVQEYEEAIEYTEDGKIDYYKSMGVIDWFRDGGAEEGKIEEYYIYDNDGKEPKYYLSLDDNLGYCIPALVRFY